MLEKLNAIYFVGDFKATYKAAKDAAKTDAEMQKFIEKSPAATYRAIANEIARLCAK